MVKKILGFIFLIAVFGLLVIFAYAQEQITITTYYPSPFGSYQDLETQRLAVAYPAGAAVFTNNFINVRTGYADTTISIGGDGAGDDAEIRLNAPAGRSTVSFQNVNTGRLARINAAICLRRTFGPNTQRIECPVNYSLAMGPGRPEDSNWSAVTSGSYLCCVSCDDLDYDGLCD